MEKAELTALIVKAQSGDPGAMEEVLKTAHTSVSYQCRKLLRDPRDAEDMTQEVLLVVYTKLDSLKTPEAFWGWLNQTTANRCVNALKRNRVELQFAEDEEGHSVLDSLEELDEQQVPDKALDNTETTRMIEEIVEDYNIVEDVKTNGLDVAVDVNLKQWRYYGTKIFTDMGDIGPGHGVSVEQERDASTAPSAKTYTVQKGDTLWAIAAKYYGKGSEYSKITQANTDKISNPNLIYPGQVLTLP